MAGSSFTEWQLWSIHKALLLKSINTYKYQQDNVSRQHKPSVSASSPFVVEMPHMDYLLLSHLVFLYGPEVSEHVAANHKQ